MRTAERALGRSVGVEHDSRGIRQQHAVADVLDDVLAHDRMNDDEAVAVDRLDEEESGDSECARSEREVDWQQLGDVDEVSGHGNGDRTKHHQRAVPLSGRASPHSHGDRDPDARHGSARREELKRPVCGSSPGRWVFVAQRRFEIIEEEVVVAVAQVEGGGEGEHPQQYACRSTVPLEDRGAGEPTHRDEEEWCHGGRREHFHVEGDSAHFALGRGDGTQHETRHPDHHEREQHSEL